MDALVHFFDKIVSDFSWKRISLVVVLLALVIISLMLFEHFTGYNKSNRINDAIDQLIQLSDPELKENVATDPELSQIYDDLKNELEEFVSPASTSLGIPSWIIKFLSSLAPWVLLAVAIAFIDNSDWKTFLGGLIIVAIPFALVGLILPTYEVWWINHILYPWGSFVFAVLLIFAIQKMRDKHKKADD